jgi:hypothetical protein
MDIYNIRYLHLPMHYQDIRRLVRGRRPLTHWAELITPEETNDGLHRSFASLALYYWPERGEELHIAYVFDMRGEGGGQWTLEIAGGQATARPGRAERPDVEIRLSPGDLLDLQNKELGAIRALVTGRLRVRPLSRLPLVARLKRLFEIT